MPGRSVLQHLVAHKWASEAAWGRCSRQRPSRGRVSKALLLLKVSRPAQYTGTLAPVRRERSCCSVYTAGRTM